MENYLKTSALQLADELHCQFSALQGDLHQKSFRLLSMANGLPRHQGALSVEPLQ